MGKSTLFNALTGSRQHTGNWPGKTVGSACGTLTHCGEAYTLVDLPGTYTLDGVSEDERIVGEYLSASSPDCVAVVCDASCLERSLILALQVVEKCDRVVVCLNLMDEAERNGLAIDVDALSGQLGVPVIPTSASRKRGLNALLDAISITTRQMPVLQNKTWSDPIYDAEQIAKVCILREDASKRAFLRKVDRLMVSRRFGVPLMFLLLLGIIWLTVWGANYPGAFLEAVFSAGYDFLQKWSAWLPEGIRGALIDGVYATCARVISVMLPPMAIFFPLFTLLEDVGYLPRMAFLMDPCMAKCGGCGKQALTLCMGLGCNAVGVMNCRIIDSPRERLCAILTNAMVPCNGRFPTLIILAGMFFSEAKAAFAVSACVALGVTGAMASSGVLSKTVLKSQESTFAMEIPPFRCPRLGKILVDSIFERTLFVAGRALCVAAPSGLLLWFMSEYGLLQSLGVLLDPLGRWMGMNGIILLGFLFSLPANELLIPVILMTLTGGSLHSVSQMNAELLMQMMTWQMALCTMVFSVFHWPCSTTILAVYKETRSPLKTVAAILLPTAIGVLLCGGLSLILQELGG